MTLAGLASRALGVLGAVMVTQYVRARLARGRAAPPSPELARAAIRAANATYLEALRAADAAAYAAVFAPDAVSLPADGKVLRGREAIEGAMSHALASATYRDGALQTVELLVFDDLAYEIGNYQVEYARRSRPKIATGRYFAVWERLGEDWRLALEAGQPGAPPAV